MKTTTTAVAAAGMLILGAITAPIDAEAQCRGCVAAGVLGGVAAGAIIGGAIANSAPVYAPGYAPYPAYPAPVPVGCPGGYLARRPLVDRFGNFIGYSQPYLFCP